MSEKNLLIVLLVLCNFQANAQQILVCDGATRFPLRDVETLADDKPVGKTDYLGHIVLPENFSTATFRRRGFHNEKLKREEVLRDTVFLFPAEHYLDEVIVTAKQIVDGNALLKRMPKRDILEKAPPHPINEFDLGMMLDRRRRRDKEHVEKLRKIFKKLDGTDVEDPILRAYNETKREQEKEKQRKSAK
ncbi:hypothetical protein [Prevotella corporis]|uniref:hypothetical protein n=1 Tax=Prevotella corporis TaxID=28128 RepID=UPI0023F496E2|nr:hypothetical protein [Prevotella corporis]